MIDREIHRGYRLYPCNYVAADLLAGTDVYAGHYTIDDKQKFESYLASQLLRITLENKDEAFLRTKMLDSQLSRITLENKDEAFLRTKMLEMYANPLKNHLKAMEV